MEAKLKDYIESFSAASFNLGYYLGHKHDKKELFEIETPLTLPKSGAGAVRRPDARELLKRTNPKIRQEEQAWDENPVEELE